MQSHPSWVRGLKRWCYPVPVSCRSRTPRGCVDWNYCLTKINYLNYVAPLVGAWIETWNPKRVYRHAQSHPSWVRGLKPCSSDILQDDSVVAPLVGAWIETERRSTRPARSLSRTPRGCVDWNRYVHSTEHSEFCRTPRGCVDWNSDTTPYFYINEVSHPSWVRGLKRKTHSMPNWMKSRTPRGCVDWNTIRYLIFLWLKKSHPSWVRGLKLSVVWLYESRICRTPRGCVDWNSIRFAKICLSWVAPLVGAWIETPSPLPPPPGVACRTPRGCVDWNIWL